ncbi:DUF3817 domain-containing protein [Streptomyces sp. NPDC056144]|uniref:DUF3817 domain-containing protein n=1 Tax=unclassified Streptomyces TaxID=2593676 RepID=UPI0035D9242A
MKETVLTRYRVMAYITAIWLLVFTGAIVAKYVFEVGDTMLISQIHGVLFIIYVLFAFDLGSKMKWPFGRLLWVLAAGCIPFASFFVEPKVTREARALIAGTAAPAPVKV